MPTKNTRELNAFHAADDKIRPRYARALTKAMKKLQATLPLNKVIAALSVVDVHLAIQLVDALPLEDALTPSVAIINDTITKGGKLAAEQINGQ